MIFVLNTRHGIVTIVPGLRVLRSSETLQSCALPVISPCPAVYFPLLPTCICNHTSRHHMDRLPSHTKHRTIFCSLQPFLQVPQTSVTSSNASTCSSSSLWRKRGRWRSPLLLLHLTRSRFDLASLGRPESGFKIRQEATHGMTSSSEVQHCTPNGKGSA